MKDCAHVPELGGRQLPATKPPPTIEELREYLDYNPETGVLRWKNWIGRRARLGQPTASGLTGDGYKVVSFAGRKFYAHRVAFALHHGRWPTPCCDHIDGDKTNNRADNLRECSVSANSHNAKMHRDNNAGVKGVHRVAHGGYRAGVMINGILHRKRFRRLEDAVAYIKQLRERLHGDFARH